MANVIATPRNASGGTGVPWPRRRLTLLAGLVVGLAVCCAYAQPSARPLPALSLDVEGKIANTNDAAHRTYHFSEAQLLALPAHTITTSTTWTPRSTFTGPRLADILKAVGAHGTEIEFRTFDDYTYSVPVTDCERYGVIVAYSMNGQRLKLSDFGPLFLIYPRDAFPDELTGAVGDSKFIWQIKALIVK
ncbi:molybdopterin-dependent oxidoreductase [Paraburkholderia sprentiae WSM5005]|uniref:Molybdopterin-dependent oxidoreductase n=1 Tax=Paraburkholderia sprentiae WSM5005 TaxID=754502 RepID=A0A1I9YLP9_9BURK|nr:molybdopterin-dependent oxidoreductase [Paraburkholderia sprentiae]APA87232.1 molybdopterin-dependent oxidoreductase [Paraburkholderia sprentiae WSM5005]